MKELLLYMAKILVDDPEAVTVTEINDEDGKVLELRVAEGDMGKVIGPGNRRRSWCRPCKSGQRSCPPGRPSGPENGQSGGSAGFL